MADTKPGWLQETLTAVEQLPTVAESLAHLFQKIHNEMTAGSGTTNPVGITQALMDNAEDIAKAVEAVGESLKMVEAGEVHQTGSSDSDKV